jgi:hypothetical protein
MRIVGVVAARRERFSEGKRGRIECQILEYRTRSVSSKFFCFLFFVLALPPFLLEPLLLLFVIVVVFVVHVVC